MTAAVYSTSEDVLDDARDAAADAGVALSENLTGPVFVNQTAAFSDFHGTGRQPGGQRGLRRRGVRRQPVPRRHLPPPRLTPALLTFSSPPDAPPCPNPDIRCPDSGTAVRPVEGMAQ